MPTAGTWENASRAFLDVVQRSMTPMRRALGAGTIDPEPPARVETDMAS